MSSEKCLMDDASILDLFWARSEQAISETDRKYGRMCADIAEGIVFDIQDARECVNDTYLGLWNAIPPARPNVFSSFIAKITRNIAMKKITYMNAKKRSAKATTSFSELDECVAAPDRIEYEAETIELSRCLESFLKNLDYESRNIFLRRYWFFDSIEDISKRFNVSQSKIKSQLFRLRKKLRKHLAAEGYLTV